MSDRAKEFLTEWSLKRGSDPIDPHEVPAIAERWEAEAIENGVSLDDLHRAAGGPIAEYLLRTYGAAE